MQLRHACWILLGVVGSNLLAPAQGRPDSAALITAQRASMARLAWMDGEWRGPAWTLLPNGEKHAITQTERIGDTSWPAAGAVAQE